jgi:parvulin-like peptidyl-prolyl isomerase
MTRLIFSFCATAALALAQLPAAPPPATADSDPVVAVVEGQIWKKSEVERFARSLPAAVQRNFYADKRAFLRTFAVMTKLAKLAETEGLDKQDPHQFRLLYNRNLYLAQVRIEAQNARQTVQPEDQRKYYEEHKSEFSHAQVKVIFLAFNDNPLPTTNPNAKKFLTGAEAEKLASSISAQARAGADFVALVKKYSQDEDSKAKDGDFPAIKPTDNALPAPIRAAVFALTPGQVSDAIRQPGGFWVIKMVNFLTAPYDEVKDQIFTAIQEGRVRQWMEKLQQEVVVEYKDQKYLDDKSPAK